MTPVLSAQPLCRVVFERTGYPRPSAAVQKIVKTDAFVQWLLWEQRANLAEYQKSTAPVEIRGVLVPAGQVDISIYDHLPPSVKDFFIRGDRVLFLQHPYNSSGVVPFQNLPGEAVTRVYETASRSMAFVESQLRGFTIKTATDYPHGRNREYEPGKIKTNEDIQNVAITSPLIAAGDQMWGPDDDLIILPDVMTIADKKSGIGELLRDVRKLDDGMYYLPALSIPFVGKEIAELNHENFVSFWQKHYAEPLGALKAKLLVRYALQMQTPNAQNFLIQLDRNLKPTGKMVIRDLNDARLVKPIAASYGWTKELENASQTIDTPVETIYPFFSNSVMHFENPAGFALSYDPTVQWAKAHNSAMIAQVGKMLGVKIPDYFFWPKLIKTLSNYDEIPQLTKFFRSQAAQAALLKKRSQN